MEKRLFMDVHVIQAVPPSCINRDDTGSPKTAIYGGATRARVSSQAWKRAMRKMWETDGIFSADQLGKRTKKVLDLLADEIALLDTDADSRKLAEHTLKAAGISINKDELADALFFISYAQIKALAQFAVESPDPITANASSSQKKQAKALLQDHPSIDIALFGRMVASDPQLNVDASAQVAHSISTHKIVSEYDYFTAVDDVINEEHSGAGHIGTVEFNSSTLYRYATVALHDLHKQVKDDLPAAASGFIRAFALSMPTGKQNTFANRTLPSAILVSFRYDQPVNFVGAFEKPVQAGRSADDGYTSRSIAALASHAKNSYETWISEPVESFVVGDGLAGLGTNLSLLDLLKHTEDFVSEVATGGGSE